MVKKLYKKGINQLMADLEDHLFLLKIAYENHKTHRAYFKLIMSELRILLLKTNDLDLLFHLAKKFNYNLTYNKRLSFRPKETFQREKLTKFLHEKIIIISGDQLKLLDFLRIMANEGGGSHEKDTLTNYDLFGKGIILGGYNPNELLLVDTAKVVLNSANEFIDYVKSLTKEDLKKLDIDVRKIKLPNK